MNGFFTINLRHRSVPLRTRQNRMYRRVKRRIRPEERKGIKIARTFLRTLRGYDLTITRPTWSTMKIVYTKKSAV